MSATILLVEDNENNRYLLTFLLERHGYRVVHAGDGPSAITLAAGARPALILLDIQLPGMNGYEVARRLRADPALAAVPLVAVTSFAMAGDRVVMGEATQLMLHRAWTLAIGNEGELDAVAKLLRQLDTEAAKVYSRRSGLTVDHIADMLRGEGEGDGTWLSADEAIELGLADETTADVPTLDDDSLDVSQLDTLRIAAFLPGGNTMPKTKLSKRPADDTHLDSEDEQLEQEQDDEADNGADTESTAGDADTADDAGADDAGDEAADSDGGEPANFEQLQQLAGDDAQFIVAQQAAKASLPTATKAYIAHLKAQRDAAAEFAAEAATTRQDDCVALLALLRLLEQRHRDIRENAFRTALPTSRHSLYSLLRDIEVNGGWPYIQRMKLRLLFANLFPEENDDGSPLDPPIDKR